MLKSCDDTNGLQPQSEIIFLSNLIDDRLKNKEIKLPSATSAPHRCLTFTDMISDQHSIQVESSISKQAFD